MKEELRGQTFVTDDGQNKNNISSIYSSFERVYMKIAPYKFGIIIMSPKRGENIKIIIIYS